MGIDILLCGEISEYPAATVGEKLLQLQDILPGIPVPVILIPSHLSLRENREEGGQGDACILREDVGRVHVSHETKYSEILWWHVWIKPVVWGEELGDLYGDSRRVGLHVVSTAQEGGAGPWGEGLSEAGANHGA